MPRLPGDVISAVTLAPWLLPGGRLAAAGHGAALAEHAPALGLFCHGSHRWDTSWCGSAPTTGWLSASPCGFVVLEPRKVTAREVFPAPKATENTLLYVSVVVPEAIWSSRSLRKSY